MKLISCEIQNFGLLHTYTVDFNDGLNEFCSLNGSGKSTLCVFIKAMLYGLPASTKMSVEENERKHYQPWQGGNFGGSLSFEAGGKRYRIERFFGSKESEDSFTLIDLSTNLKSRDYSANVGFELFGVGAEAYEKSTYLGQRVVPAKAGRTDLEAKLNHLMDDAGDLGAYDQAMEQLDKNRRQYTVQGGRGLIPDLESRIDTLQTEKVRYQNEILQATTRKEQIADLKERIAEAEAGIKSVDESVVKYEKQKARADVVDTYRSLCKKANAAAEKEKTLREEFGGVIPTQREIEEKDRKYHYIAERLSEAQKTVLTDEEAETLKRGKKQFANGVPSSAVIDEAFRTEQRRQEVERELAIYEAKENQDSFEMENREKGNRKVRLGCFAGAGVLAVAGIVLLILSLSVVGIVLLALAAVAVVLGFVLGKGKSKAVQTGETPEQAIARLREEREKLIGRIYRIIGEVPVDSIFETLRTLEKDARDYTALAGRKKEIDEKKEQFTDRMAQEAGDLIAFLSAWFENVTPKNVGKKLEELVSRLRDLESAESEKIRTAKERDEYARERTITPEEATGNDLNIRELNAKKSELEKSLKQMRNELAKCEAQKEHMGDPEEALTATETEIAEAEEKLAGYRANLQAIEGAKSYLTKAREALSSRYLGTLQENFGRSMTALAGSAEGYEIDSAFEVKIRAEGKSRSAEYLSRGYRDLVELCTRFALVDALFENERPFLVLDDPFTNLDEQKIGEAKRLLGEIAERFQILYFTCSPSRMIV